MVKPKINRLSYCPTTGAFTWVIPASHRVNKGDTAGGINDNGYRIISLDKIKYRAHWLAWYISYGNWPKNQIDHINGVRDDNRLINLREATNAENRQNMGIRSDNKSGFIGVYYAKWANAWRAEIRVNGNRRKLGYFDAPEKAHLAYLNAKAQLHSFNPVPRNA